jgi:hypothetical protein
MFATNTKAFGGFLAALGIAVLSAGLLTYRSAAALAATTELSRADDSEDDSKAREQSANNLKQILLAMHNYHDTYGRLPAVAFHDKDDKPLLSWRVALLPFLEEADLYKQLKLDEPWDSENNKALLSRMPKVYAPVRGKHKENATVYQVFTGKDMPFQEKRQSRIPASFPDGTSNTILVVEAAESVPWTKPADLAYDDTKDFPKLGGMFKDRFHVALCDGSVRAVRLKFDEPTMKAFINPSTGLVKDFSKIEADK